MKSPGAPWVKRIELSDGQLRAMELRPGEPFVTAYRAAGGHAASDRFEFVGDAWFHVGHRWVPARRELEEGEDDDDAGEPVVERRWAIHGTSATSGSAVYTFMEHVEARHPELEAALGTDASARSVYADWLEEQGDPYAAALKPELLKERGPAGRWFLEGLDRSGLVGFTLDDALVREVKLGAVPSADFAELAHRVCHLRASVALEHLSMQRPTDVHARWGANDGPGPDFWRTVWLPPSLRVLTVAEFGQPDAMGRLRAHVAKTHPSLELRVL